MLTSIILLNLVFLKSSLFLLDESCMRQSLHIFVELSARCYVPKLTMSVLKCNCPLLSKAKSARLMVSGKKLTGSNGLANFKLQMIFHCSRFRAGFLLLATIALVTVYVWPRHERGYEVELVIMFSIFYLFWIAQSFKKLGNVLHYVSEELLTIHASAAMAKDDASKL